MKNINENKPNGRRSRVIFAMHKISIINRPSSLDSPKLLLRDSSWVVNSLEGLPGQTDNEKVGALTCSYKSSGEKESYPKAHWRISTS